MRLRPDERLTLVAAGRPLRVERLIGVGGQGEVYRAEVDGRPVALKWYHEHTATPQLRESLERLTRQTPPSKQFLWPIDVATRGGSDFGYIMPLREERFRDVTDLLDRTRPIHPEPTPRTLVTVAMELAHNFLQLHARGLCYRDINLGNVFFEPATGSVLICDNDNVTVNGTAWSAVVGTLGFIAPEVLRGEAPPNTSSDLFSLAVLIFYLLINHHPLDGKRADRVLDYEATLDLYGRRPLFVFDPKDDSNGLVPGEHKTPLVLWPLYPRFVRDLFTKAFTDGLRDPRDGRVMESVWRLSMAQLRDLIVYCPSCGVQVFCEPAALPPDAPAGGSCWRCGRSFGYPFRLHFGGEPPVMLNHDTRLFAFHLDERRPYDFGAPQAEVAQHPTNKDVWGLKNLGAATWTTSKGDVAPGRSVTLAPGVKVRFGKREAEVRF